MDQQVGLGPPWADGERSVPDGCAVQRIAVWNATIPWPAELAEIGAQARSECRGGAEIIVNGCLDWPVIGLPPT